MVTVMPIAIQTNGQISLIVSPGSTLQQSREKLYRIAYDSKRNFNRTGTLQMRQFHPSEIVKLDLQLRLKKMTETLSSLRAEYRHQQFLLAQPSIKYIAANLDRLSGTPALRIVEASMERASYIHHNGHRYPDWCYHLVGTIQFLGGKRSLSFWNGSED